MTEEKNATYNEGIAVQDDAQAQENEESKSPSSKKKHKKRNITLGVILVIVLVGVGFYVWHEQPRFCADICHTPMDPYLANYEQDYGVEGTDKWGNEVSDTSSMIAVAHRENADAKCMSCHVPTMSEQVHEGLSWISGNYEAPLSEKTTEQLTAARGVDGDEFCLNESCHNMTRADLVQATSNYERNPHSLQHAAQGGALECSSCHKAHRASTNYCSRCHDDAPIPEGWLSYTDSTSLSNSVYNSSAA